MTNSRLDKLEICIAADLMVSAANPNPSVGARADHTGTLWRDPTNFAFPNRWARVIDGLRLTRFS